MASLLIACLLLAATGAPVARGRGAAPTAQDTGATRVRIYAPIGGRGINPALQPSATLSGSCFAGSVADSQRPDAFRCSAGNRILDPCFGRAFGPNDTPLVCPAAPDSADVLLLQVTDPLPRPAGSHPDLTMPRPWVLELANGAVCTPFTGTRDSVAGLIIGYGCSDGGGVAGEIDPSSPLWRVFYLPPGGDVLDQVEVSTAWF